MAKKNQLKRWMWALTSPDNRGLISLLFAVGAVTAFVGVKLGQLPYLAFSAFFFGGLGLIVKYALQCYDRVGEATLNALAYKWVREGKTAQEVTDRGFSLRTLGAAGVLGAAGYALSNASSDESMFSSFEMNTDGTHMMEGGVIDVHGKTFGMSEDQFSFDVDNGMTMFSGDEYSAPIGMKND